MFSLARSSPTGQKGKFSYNTCTGSMCVAAVDGTTPLTGQETGQLFDIAVVLNVTSGGAHIGVHVGEGQQLAALVSVIEVHLQQALIRGEVSEKAGLDVVCAVHLTHIDEGREGVDLLPDVASTKHVTRVARPTSRRRAEERDALLGARAEARIVPGNLRPDVWSVFHARVYLSGACKSCTRGVTSMGKQGSVCSQLFSQSMPLLKERMTGE